MIRHRLPVASFVCLVLFATGTAFCEASHGSAGLPTKVEEIVADLRRDTEPEGMQ
jgi:hypothetical protein